MSFKDETKDLSPSNVASTTLQYMISPDYFRAAGTALLSGRAFTFQDDKNAPAVAVINQEFARRVFGSEREPLGRYFKTADGTRRQAAGIVEDGKYFNFSEAQLPAMFLPILQTGQLNSFWLLVRSPRYPQQLATEIRTKLRALDDGAAPDH